jgi:exodeoxyribonuclease V alpha subunit
MNFLWGALKMSEQLSVDFDAMPTKKNGAEEPIVYEALDYQIAALLQEQNGEKNSTLEKCILNISKNTREGQIFSACNATQQTELLLTKVVGQAGDYKPLIVDKDFLYLRRYFLYQQQLADDIRTRITASQSTQSPQIESQEKRLDYYFDTDKESKEPNWQRVAAERALQSSFLVLSGGPGTGKTTTISRILCLLIEQFLLQKKGGQFHIALAAPTGKAAVRMMDALRHAQQRMNLPQEVVDQLPKQASTLHKLLGYKHNSVQFKHHRNNPLQADVVLIDESSMIDIALMSKLVEAVPEGAKLILVGDKDQLSSVETGSVFADICAGIKDTQNIVSLQKNWRFSHDSAIGQLAQAINNGDSKNVLALLKDEKSSDCHLLSPSIIDKNQIPDDFLTPWKDYFELINNPQSSLEDIFNAFNQFRVLCALRKGLNGSTIMSERIETALLKKGLIKRRHQQLWYPGRPIMITQNNYSKGLFNGDTGLTLIKNNQTKVYFPDDSENHPTFKSFAPVRLSAYETTWAETIHKSQGSEFDQVSLIMPHEVNPLLSRQLIYTGVTRARKVLTIIANEEILTAGIETKRLQSTRVADQLS